MGISKKAFSSYIKKKREEKGLSREELANNLRVSYDVVYRWETGVRFPDYEMVESLASELGVSIQELYDNSKSDEQPGAIRIIAPILLLATLIGACIIGLSHGGYGRNKIEMEGDIIESVETTSEDISRPKVYYKMTPNDPEWAKLTYGEQVKAADLPKELLVDVETSDLLMLALDYPLLGDMFLFDSLDKGFDAMIARSSVWEELMSREGVGELARDILDEGTIDDYVKEKALGQIINALGDRCHI